MTNGIGAGLRDLFEIKKYFKNQLTFDYVQ